MGKLSVVYAKLPVRFPDDENIDDTYRDKILTVRYNRGKLFVDGKPLSGEAHRHAMKAFESKYTK